MFLTEIPLWSQRQNFLATAFPVTPVRVLVSPPIGNTCTPTQFPIPLTLLSTGVINIWGSRKYGDPPSPNSREFGDPFVSLGILCDRVRQRT